MQQTVDENNSVIYRFYYVTCIGWTKKLTRCATELSIYRTKACQWG